MSQMPAAPPPKPHGKERLQAAEKRVAKRVHSMRGFSATAIASEADGGDKAAAEEDPEEAEAREYQKKMMSISGVKK